VRQLSTVVDNKLACAKVRAVRKNIINSCGAEIGAVLVDSKLGSILGIALRTELGTALIDLCTIVDIKLEDNVKLGSKLGTILDAEIKLGTKVGTLLDRELCTVAADIKLGSKLGTVLDRGCHTVVVDNIKVGSKLRTGLDRELGTVVLLNTKLGSKLGSGLDRELCTYSKSKLVPDWERDLIEDIIQQYSISNLVPNWGQYLIEDIVQ
jgi:hypothetical protein